MLQRFRNAASAVCAEVLFLDVDGARISANLQHCSRRLHVASCARYFTLSRLLKVCVSFVQKWSLLQATAACRHAIRDSSSSTAA